MPSPPSANPWDAPPFPKRGNRSSRVLYEAIGRALTTWELLETYLAKICMRHFAKKAALMKRQITTTASRSIFLVAWPNFAELRTHIS